MARSRRSTSRATAASRRSRRSSSTKAARSSMVRSQSSAMVAPPTLTDSASGLSRVPSQRGQRDWRAIAREEHPHVELVAVRLHLLEEPLDPAEAVGARVDPRAIGGGKLAIRAAHVHPALLGRLEELLLVPAPRRMRPGLHRAVGEAPRGIGHHQLLVVAEDIAEALALGAGPEGMVEREEERLRPGQGRLAARAAVLAADRDHRAAQDVHLGPALALGQRGLEGLGHPAPRLAAERHAVQDDQDAAAPARGRAGRRAARRRRRARGPRRRP